MKDERTMNFITENNGDKEQKNKKRFKISLPSEGVNDSNLVYHGNTNIKKDVSSLYSKRINTDKENQHNTRILDEDGQVLNEIDVAENLLLLKETPENLPIDGDSISSMLYSNKNDVTDFPDKNTPLLQENGSISSIQPIYGSLKIYSDRTNVGLIDTYSKLLKSEGHVYKEDLMKDFKNIANQEIKGLEHITVDTAEMVFSPPTFASKQPIEYLRDEIKLRRSRTSIIKNKQRASEIAVDHDSANSNFRNYNDLDENIFVLDPISKTYYCPWDSCDKSFPSLSRIKRHYIIHTDIKPFKCLNKGCNRDFSRKDNMLQHCRVHCPYAERNRKDISA